MSRPRNDYPKLCTSAAGRAFCKVDGRFISLGRSGTPESKRRYNAVLRALDSGESVLSTTPTQSIPSIPTTGPSINELCLRFITDYCQRYRTAAGEDTPEVHCIGSVVAILRTLFGETSAAEFGPLRLRTVRDAMVKNGWSRKYINKQIGRAKLIFRIGVSWEMVPGSVTTELDTMPCLAEGETAARETEDREAVPQVKWTP